MHHDTMRMSIFMDLVKQMSNTYVDEQSEQNYKCGWEIYTIVSFSYNDTVTNGRELFHLKL
jgi:hypothetical protein